MKPLVYLLLFFLFSCESPHRIIVTNGTSIPRVELVELSVRDLQIKLPLSEGEHYLVTDEQGAVVPSQTTYDGKLIFTANVVASSTSEYHLTKGKEQTYPSQVSGRYFEERYGDFAWENDKVGFRFYGAPLKAIQAPTNGLDLWYKRTDAMVLEKWYKNDLSKTASYHVDHGEGCDPYGVGPTLGGGAMAPYIAGSIVRNENFDTYEILDNGPLRLTVKLTYPDMQIGDKAVIDVRTISLDAGSQYTQITQDYGDAEFSVAAGIVKRPAGDSLLVSTDKTNLIYIEPSSADNGQIYLGLVFEEGFEAQVTDSYAIGKNTFSHVLALSSYRGRPLTYYTGFGWSKSGYANVGIFETYTRDYVISKRIPLEVVLSKQ